MPSAAQATTASCGLAAGADEIDSRVVGAGVGDPSLRSSEWAKLSPLSPSAKGVAIDLEALIGASLS